MCDVSYLGILKSTVLDNAMIILVNDPKFCLDKKVPLEKNLHFEIIFLAANEFKTFQ